MVTVVAKFRTFRKVKEATGDDYHRLTPAERLEIPFQLRTMAHKEGDAISRRLASLHQIAQLKQDRK
jgi:hypothetical protein